MVSKLALCVCRVASIEFESIAKVLSSISDCARAILHQQAFQQNSHCDELKRRQRTVIALFCGAARAPGKEMYAYFHQFLIGGYQEILKQIGRDGDGILLDSGITLQSTR